MASLEVEIAIDGDIAGSGSVTEIELAPDVSMPSSVSLDGMVVNVGNAPGLLVLEASDPVPPGTPVGTVILRKE
jgi:hypothetical protein